MSVYSLFNSHALISFVQFYLNMNKLQLNPKAEGSMHPLCVGTFIRVCCNLTFVVFVRLFNALRKYE